jgi:hypothetical protein
MALTDLGNGIPVMELLSAGFAPRRRWEFAAVAATAHGGRGLRCE